MRCTKLKTFVKIVALLCLHNTANAQFAPAANEQGTTAIAGSSPLFVEWASGCTVQRGPMNIANPGLGLASAGDSTDAIGQADAAIVSLGDGGTATLTFNHPIYNDTGFDFAVFENGFINASNDLAFLELGFVEVSTDGIRYVRFPATSNVQDTLQLGNNGSIDCSQLNNLAGKYVAGYGTPFDLQELVDSPGIDVNNINYVRILDVVGSIDSAYGTRDHNGRLINDPWPTPFASCGFDLDALGVINSKGALGIKDISESGIRFYPNPVRQGSSFKIQLTENTGYIKLFSLSGQLINQWPVTGVLQTINAATLSRGVYFITVETSANHFNTKLVVE